LVLQLEPYVLLLAGLDQLEAQLLLEQLAF